MRRCILLSHFVDYTMENKQASKEFVVTPVTSDKPKHYDLAKTRVWFILRQSWTAVRQLSAEACYGERVWQAYTQFIGKLGKGGIGSVLNMFH